MEQREFRLLPQQENNRFLCVLFSFFVFLASFILLNVTSRILPMCWDEGDALWRAEQVERWAFLRSEKREARSEKEEAIGESSETRQSLSQLATRNSQLPFITYSEGHPAFYGLLATVGDVLGRRGAGINARTFFLFFYAMAIGGVFWKLYRKYPENIMTALMAVASMILIPRLYCHAHFAVNDSILISCWVLSWVCFTENEKPCSAWQAIPFGLFLGLTMASKFTGWLAIPCFVGLWIFHRNRNLLAYLLVGLCTALLTFYVVNPPLWFNPIDGMSEFFSRNLGREQTFNLTGYFFGRLYNITNSLPWYNTTVWVLITVPVGILALIVLGIKELWKSRQTVIIQSLIFNAVILLIIRALPHTPAHDNERLIIPAFAFLAIVAGLGANRLMKIRYKVVSYLALSLIVMGSVSSWIVYAPHWLSYYNLTVGGLPGAYRLGLEPTYWWTDLDDSTLDWINSHCKANEKVEFQLCSRYNLNKLIADKKLRVNYATVAPGRYRWYVMQTRPSVMSDRDWNLSKNQIPAYTVSIPFAGPGPWNLQSVPLIRIYDLNEPSSN